jgi:hypothetical protein
MVEFQKCEENCIKEGANEQHEKLVSDLNAKFADKGCSCHPNATWIIGVDFMSNCSYKFHEPSLKPNPSCGFAERLIKGELKDYLTTV